jgi:hypothetical protein
MKIFDINVFDWADYEGESGVRIGMHAYPAEMKGGVYQTNASADSITLWLGDLERKEMGLHSGADLWVHSDYLQQVFEADGLDTKLPRVYDWLKSLNEQE